MPPEARCGGAARVRRLPWFVVVSGIGALACAVGAALGRGDDDHALMGMVGGVLALVLWSFVGLFLAVANSMLRRNGRALPSAIAPAWYSTCAVIVGLSLSCWPKSWWLERQFALASEWAGAKAAQLDVQCSAGQRPLELDLADAPAWADDGRFSHALSTRSYTLALQDPSGRWTIWEHGKTVRVSPWRP